MNSRDPSTAQSRHTPLLTDLSLTFQHFLIFLHWTCNNKQFFVKKLACKGRPRPICPTIIQTSATKQPFPLAPQQAPSKKKKKANPGLVNLAPIFHLDNQVPLFSSQSICLGEGGKSAKPSPWVISTSCGFSGPFLGLRSRQTQEQNSD